MGHVMDVGEEPTAGAVPPAPVPGAAPATRPPASTGQSGSLLTCLLVEESPMAQVGPLRKHLGPGCARLLRLCSGCCSVGLLIWLLSAVCTFAETSHFLLSP